MPSQFSCMAAQFLFFHIFQCSYRSSRCQQVAAECIGMSTRRPVHYFAARQHGTKGQAGTQCLCHAYYISPYPEILHSHEGTCAPAARLHLIGHHQQIMVVTDAPDLLVELGRRYDITTLALHRLHNNGSSVIGTKFTLEDK